MRRFENTYRFCDGHIIKFCLIFQEDVYPYRHMDSWEIFGETSLQAKKEF